MGSYKIITVDGPSASGKTSIAKALAEKLGFYFLSSGVVYRSLGYIVLQKGCSPSDETEALRCVEDAVIDFSFNENRSGIEVKIDNENVTNKLYSPGVSEMASKLSVFPEIRKLATSYIKSLSAEKDIVIEGRDMGTRCFPDADLKFFVTADPEVRAERRMAQLGLKDRKSPEALAELQKITKKEIEERDLRDTTRAIDPLQPARDAIIIDNTSGSLTETVERVYDAVRRHGIKGNELKRL